MKHKPIVPRGQATQPERAYDHIDVWRVLHGQRNIPLWMQDSALWAQEY
jgi:plasmid stabilization system protein ParE